MDIEYPDPNMDGYIPFQTGSNLNTVGKYPYHLHPYEPAMSAWEAALGEGPCELPSATAPRALPPLAPAAAGSCLARLHTPRTAGCW